MWMGDFNSKKIWRAYFVEKLYSQASPMSSCSIWELLVCIYPKQYNYIKIGKNCGSKPGNLLKKNNIIPLKSPTHSSMIVKYVAIFCSKSNYYNGGSG